MHQYIHVDGGWAIALHIGIRKSVNDFGEPVDTRLKILIGS